MGPESEHSLYQPWEKETYIPNNLTQQKTAKFLGVSPIDLKIWRNEKLVVPKESGSRFRPVFHYSQEDLILGLRVKSLIGSGVDIDEISEKLQDSDFEQLTADAINYAQEMSPKKLGTFFPKIRGSGFNKNNSNAPK